MADLADGGPLPEQPDGPPDFCTPCAYSAPHFHPTIPGADWFIEGRRFREVGRIPNANGATVHLAAADTPPPFH